MSLGVARAAEQQPGPRPPVRESGPPGPSRPSSGTSVSLSCCVWGPVLSVPPTAPVRLTPARASGPGTRHQHSAPAPSPCSWHLVSVTSTFCSDLPGLPVSQPAPWGAVPGVLPSRPFRAWSPLWGGPNPQCPPPSGAVTSGTACASCHLPQGAGRGGAGGGAGWGSADQKEHLAGGPARSRGHASLLTRSPPLPDASCTPVAHLPSGAGTLFPSRSSETLPSVPLCPQWPCPLCRAMSMCA